ncbi:MAG: surface antigen (D15) [Gallionellaceae bacterium]|nr:MAG: surface antigen (D15) [Gallionellaceae bacterium]
MNRLMIAWSLIGLLTVGWVASVQAKSGSIPAVILIAPEKVRPVLVQYFTLPEELMRTESERAVFMRRAQREIPELLMTEGYFSSKVLLRSVMISGTLELLVEPGPLTKVSAVNIELRGDIAQADAQRAMQLRKEWSLPQGKGFSSAAWDRAKTDLLTQLARKEYAAARIVDSSAKVDIPSATAQLNIVLDSGPRYRFGAMQVSGLERYSEALVTRYASFKEGELYDRNQLLIFQTRLQNLSQFSSIIVSLDMPPTVETASGAVIAAPVKVQIVEAQSRKVSTGLGYSTNNGLRSELSYLDNNFVGRAWAFSTALVLENNRQTLSTSIDTLPNPQGFRLQWLASGERTTIQGLETLRDKFGVTRSHTVYGNEFNIGLNWQQEHRIPDGGMRETNQALVLDWRWMQRAVDDPLMPMSGSLTEFRLGGAGKAVFSDEDFVRTYLRRQQWIPLGENDVVSLRGEAGYTKAQTRVNIPQEYLFRVGGTQTVRGYAYQSLGVHEGDAVVGGRAMVTASAEYTHWFTALGVAAFADAGDAADTPEALKPVIGYGFGVRWRSPVGPLALDVARSKTVSDLVYHFSIAVAF